MVLHVKVKATNEFDYNISRECRGANVQIDIVLTDCCYIYVPRRVRNFAFA